MKKRGLAFPVIIATELAALVLSVIVFAGEYTVWSMLLLAAELSVSVMIFIHAEDYENQLEIILLSLVASPIVAGIVKNPVYTVVVPVVGIIALATVELIRNKFKNSEKIPPEMQDKSELYADKSVLIIVPHQDDDINLAGGIIEKFIGYKSDVRICFYTNGDYEVSADVRLNESLKVAEFYGIPSENIIFMGYGDRWDGDEHIYNLPDEKLAHSASGKTATYALAEHPAYNEGTEYTHKNIVGDMASVIEEFRPTDIFCVDYDCHTDHIACSLFFEEALLKVLKSASGYHPTVYKGFAYETAFFSEKDFFKMNILSTVNERRTDYMQKYAGFNWRDRVRFPVSASSATRFIENSSVYKALSIYRSQSATDYAESIINGDKVFWRRRTDSLLYNARLTASSGNAEVLNDFKLFDTDCLKDFPMSVIKGLCVPNSHDFSQRGTWIPNGDDEEKSVKIELGAKTDIKTIVLYDNPSRNDNIINAEITFDNGAVIETGPLNPDGSATVIEADVEKVESFVVRITDWDGDFPGLTEIEAFESDDAESPRFIKLTDECESFVYSYAIEHGDRARLSLYSHNMPELSEGGYAIECDNEKCFAKIDGEVISVICPLGESCTVGIKSNDGIGDSARIFNPKNKKLMKKAIEFDRYHYRTLKPSSQKKYYKNMLLYFYDKLMWKIRK